jgi:probable metal-binding protein
MHRGCVSGATIDPGLHLLNGTARQIGRNILMHHETESSVHGHEVIYLIRDASTPFTRATLAAEVQRRFGAGVTFHTCSAGGMPLDHLLTFLLARQKITESPSGELQVRLENVCDEGR